MIDIIYKQPNLPKRPMQIPNKLNVFQNLIGGDIQAKEVFKGIAMITGAEAKLRGEDKNFEYGFVKIYGPAIFAGIERGKYISLTGFQQELVRSLLEEKGGANE